MDIHELKERFIDLLKLKYEVRGEFPFASLDNSLDDELIVIDDEILKKYGLDGRDFWDFICPKLKQEKILVDFEDPTWGGIPDTFYKQNPMYIRLQKDIEDLNSQLPNSYVTAKMFGVENNPKYSHVDSKIEEKEDELRKLIIQIEDQYFKCHRFKVNIKYLLGYNLSNENSNKNLGEKEFTPDQKSILETITIFGQNNKWWKPGDKPIYNEKEKIISIGDRKIVVVKNQITVCKTLFKKSIGEWLQSYEVNPPIKTKQGEKGFYYVCRGLNKHTRQDFGFEIFEVGMTRIRIKKELFLE